MNLTLKEMAGLLDNFDFGSEFNSVDIKLWDSEQGDFVDMLGFDDCHALSDAIKHIDYAGTEYLKWLDRIVTYVEVINMANGNILSIELAV